MFRVSKAVMGVLGLFHSFDSRLKSFLVGQSPHPLLPVMYVCSLPLINLVGSVITGKSQTSAMMYVSMPRS